MGSVVAAVANCDTVVQRVDVLSGEEDGKDPKRGHQREHASEYDEEPLPCPTVESIGTVSSQKNL
jgi:hypothetical protein